MARAEINATKAEARRISDEKDKEIERLKKIIDEMNQNKNKQQSN